MAIPFIPLLIGSIINAIPVLALYFLVNKSIKRLLPLISISVLYSFGVSLYYLPKRVDLTLIITVIIFFILSLVSLASILAQGQSRLKSWLLASGAIVLGTVIPFVRLRLVLDYISPTFYYPLIVVLLVVGFLSLIYGKMRSIGGPLPNGTTSKAYATKSEIDTDLAIKGRSVLLDQNLDELERKRYRDALNEKDNG